MNMGFAAFIRGINVGKGKRVAMADLRRAVAGLGYHGVETLLNSGNVVFRAEASEGEKAGARIEQAMVAELGVSARVLVVSAVELAAVLAANPLAEVANEPPRYLVAFLAPDADREKLEAIARQDWAPEAIALGANVAYLWCAMGIADSQLVEAFNKAVRDAATTRNWATLEKIQARLSAAA